MEQSWRDYERLNGATDLASGLPIRTRQERSGWTRPLGTDGETRSRNLLFPRDAVAEIYRPCRSAMTSGPRRKEWVLRFEKRMPPFIEPWMGWTGSRDALRQVELRFPDKQSAVAYAERQGLTYRLREDESREETVSPARERVEDAWIPTARSGSKDRERLAEWLFFAWLNSHYGRCDAARLPDFERALIDPAAEFDSPAQIARDPLLPLECKSELLFRWAWDESRREDASWEGMPEASSSRLDEVLSALGELMEGSARPEEDDLFLVIGGPSERWAQA